MLKVKEYFNLDELKSLGFEKAKDYYHCGNVSVRICDREVVLSYKHSRVYHPIDVKISIDSVLLKMMSEGILK